MEKEELIRLLKSSYKKYKTHIYYDNYSSIQRFKLAEFECENFRKPNNNSFVENFNNFFENFASDLLNNFDDTTSNIVNDIGVISIPKSFVDKEKYEDNHKDNKIISNFNIFNNKIDQIHYFIDLPVEGHILGVLWILRCGYVLDDKLYDHCYGNRLNDTLLDILKEDDSFNDFTPFLFKPYFKNYQSWRDNGLDCLKKVLNNKHNAFMLSLDFADYYYRSLINFDDLKKDIELTLEINDCYENKVLHDLDNHLTDFIKLVFEKYSAFFERNMSEESNYSDKKDSNDVDYKDLSMIPLGFLPSLIISNWNLQGFDQVILENIHPFYYGRYVDDILIVLESHEKSDSFEKQQLSELNIDDFLNKYFICKGESPWDKILLSSKSNISKNKSWKVYNQPISKNKCPNDSSLDYYHYENLEIQNKKLRLYKFSYKCSDSIIKNFRKEIYKNSSEFRLMHSMSHIINDLEDNIYKINYKDSINKLNDIEDIRINKYEISKLLSRLNHVSKNMYNEKLDYDIVKKVINAFEGKYLEFIILWEKLFSFLYINDYFDNIVSITKDIKNCIHSIELQNNENSKLNNNFLHKKENEFETLNESLYYFLYSSLIRTLSLKRHKKFDFDNLKILFNNKSCTFFKDINIPKDISKFLFSLMQNNHLMKYPLMDTKTFTNNKEYDLIKHENKLYILFEGIYPSFIKFNEFIFLEINNQLFNEDNQLFNNTDENIIGSDDLESYIDNSLINYNKFNFGIGYKLFTGDNKTSKIHLKNYIEPNLSFDYYKSNLDNKGKILKINSPKKDILKIGLVNTKLDKNNCIKRLKNHPNLSFKRFDDIKDLINEAINKNVDLLLMPEMFIPYEWINEIVRISKDHQMAIIFGLEPIVNKKDVGNYIMASLPFLVSDKYPESLLTYRLKNHYSPEEFKLYKKYDKKPFENDIKYYLFVWNDVYIAPYYCYEIADIKDRSIFKNLCDIVTVSEFNKDTLYFNNIAESLSRDLFCYCIKSNTSEYGGSVILQPSSSEKKYLVNLKGGEDNYIVTHNLDIKKLREDAIKNDTFSEDSYFKPKPPGFKRSIVKKRMGLEK